MILDIVGIVLIGLFLDWRLRYLDKKMSTLLGDIHSTLNPELPVFDDDETFLMIREICKKIGLNEDAISLDFNIAATGKLNDVIHLLSLRMQREHPLATVKDLIHLVRSVQNG